MQTTYPLNISTFLSHLITLPQTFIVFSICCFTAAIFLFLVKLFFIRKQMQQEAVFLELTPPAFTEKSAYTTQQLFSVLHSIGRQLSFWDRILGIKNIFSFEIISTRKDGIRYIVRASSDHADSIKRTATSYLPQVTVRQVDDYLPEKIDQEKLKIVEFKLRKHFAFPLAKQNALNHHDPVAYITGMMTELAPKELISLQIVASPTINTQVSILNHKILRNEDVIRYLQSSNSNWLIKAVVSVLGFIIKSIQELVWFVIDIFLSSPSQQRNAQIANAIKYQASSGNTKPARILTPFEQEIVSSIQEKIDQPLFEVSLRALVLLNNSHEQKQRLQSIKSSLATFSIPKYQAFYAKYIMPFKFSTGLQYFLFKNRLLSPVSNNSKSLLSVSELADLYHFPFARTTQTENIVKTYAKELPTPLSLKTGRELDVVFGKNTYGKDSVPIGITDKERAKHMYIIGQTGSGKSTIIYHMAKADIEKGRGVAVLDPHGLLVKDLLYTIPKERLNDVIYFNPFDIAYPVGINLLELPEGLTENELELEKELVCESVISIFRRVFSDEEHKNAHRIEYMLRNTIHTAFTIEDRTIFTLYKLLTSPYYREKITSNLEDENLRDFWKNEFGMAGEYQIIKMIQGVTTKVGRFLFSPTAKRILEQTKSTIDFDKILNESKVLICNLSEGKLGEDTSRLLGTTILSKIQQAALRRERMDLENYKPFYLFVDEFQNFATSSFTRMLSGGRKFGLRVTIAEQSTAQQEERRIVNIILANTGTVVCFRTASPMDEQLMLIQFSPYIDRTDIVNLPNYKFYIKIAATQPEEPFSGITLPIIVKKNPELFEAVVDASRKNYAIVYKKPKKSKNNKKQQSVKEKIEEVPEISSL